MPKVSFQGFANTVSRGSGAPAAFLAAIALVVVWAAAGPSMGYSTAWLLIINTVSSIVTFLMVFLIQNGQTRDGIAIQAKLNELIRALEEAENRFIGIERLTQKELVKLEGQIHDAADQVAEEAERTAEAAASAAE
jgi:low affinity Fe/Cu permease